MILSKDIVDKRILDFYRLRKASEVYDKLSETKTKAKSDGKDFSAHEILMPKSDLKLSYR